MPRQATKKHRMAYDYTAATELELTVQAGEDVEVLEADNAGWTQVASASGRGLVPSTYIEADGSKSVGQYTKSGGGVNHLLISSSSN